MCFYDIVNFLSQVIFIFLLFLAMVMMLMKLKQRKNISYLRKNINYNIYIIIDKEF